MTLYYDVLSNDYCHLYLESSADGLTEIAFITEDEMSELMAGTNQRSSAVHNAEQLTEVCKQLEQYFAGKREQFDLPLDATGTAFQQRVWQSLCAIPFGQTASYGQLAASLGNPNASRAVGLANGKNPIAIVVPCHRVIGANGTLTGYAGGLDNKRMLLELEGLDVKG